MSTNRPFVVSIAGFDPSGGAGVLADIKTFEQHQVYGLSVITGNTIQTETEFRALQWTDLNFTLNSIRTLFENYEIEAVKIGIVASLSYLKAIITEIRQFSSTVKIVWDTVLKSTTEFEFTTIENQTDLVAILEQINLITPNYQEISKFNPNETSSETIAKELSRYCAVLLKGGHNPNEIGTDYLFTEDKIVKINPSVDRITEKHGSGCVLSSAITANLALNYNMIISCKKAKRYIENYLNSNHSKLGYHHV